MHEKAVEKIQSKTIGCLKNCIVSNSQPSFDSIATHYYSLEEEVLKTKKLWLDSSDVFSVLFGQIINAIAAVNQESPVASVNLWDLIGEESGVVLAERISDTFINTPRNISLYIPIPSVSKNISENIILSENLSLEAFNDTQEITGRYRAVSLVTTELEVSKVFLKHSINGFPASRIENRCLKHSLNALKVILQQGIFRGIFVVKKPVLRGLAAFAGLDKHEADKLKAIVVDSPDYSEAVIHAELPMELSFFLNKIDFNWELNPIIDSYQKNKFSALVSSVLGIPTKLYESQADEAIRVRAASKWCFDSYVTDDDSLSFLQVCIGLEALLGQDTKNGPLTETLADRCSYLVGDDIKGRKTIKEKFKQLYQIRSKLVHGNVTDLDSEHLNMMKWGKTILEAGIAKEIKNLKLE